MDDTGTSSLRIIYVTCPDVSFMSSRGTVVVIQLAVCEHATNLSNLDQKIIYFLAQNIKMKTSRIKFYFTAK